jgi:3-hydroxybutyryl-CoA dehydrogenase
MDGTIRNIAIAGAGTMGAGIAQLSALAGYSTVLFDISPEQATKAQASILASLDKAADKGLIAHAVKDAAIGRLSFSNEIKDLKADMVIEAIVEQIDIKKDFFRQLEQVNDSKAIFATNTSSFSVTRVAAGLAHPQRVVGMHFFNPAHIMKLVEVIMGAESDQKAAEAVKEVAEKMDKTVVWVKDSPGFIVNRVARHFYVESLKTLEENVAPFEAIDDLMEASGFRMGPFRLMDMIGMDINYTVTTSMFEAFNFDPKFRPSRIQQQKKEAGHLGRKTGKGFYKY